MWHRLCAASLSLLAAVCGACGRSQAAPRGAQEVAAAGAAPGPGAWARWAGDLAALLRACMRQARGWPGGAHAAFQQPGFDAITVRIMLAERAVRAVPISWQLRCLALGFCAPAQACCAERGSWTLAARWPQASGKI